MVAFIPSPPKCRQRHKYTHDMHHRASAMPSCTIHRGFLQNPTPSLPPPEPTLTSWLSHVLYKVVRVGCSGRFCEVVDCGSGHAVARGITTTKQTSRRWAAMRLLQELDHTIDPAFFKDTPEGASLLHRSSADAACCVLWYYPAVISLCDILALSPLSQYRAAPVLRLLFSQQ